MVEIRGGAEWGLRMVAGGAWENFSWQFYCQTHFALQLHLEMKMKEGRLWGKNCKNSSLLICVSVLGRWVSWPGSGSDRKRGQGGGSYLKLEILPRDAYRLISRFYHCRKIVTPKKWRKD